MVVGRAIEQSDSGRAEADILKLYLTADETCNMSEYTSDVVLPWVAIHFDCKGNQMEVEIIVVQDRPWKAY